VRIAFVPGVLTTRFNLRVVEAPAKFMAVVTVYVLADTSVTVLADVAMVVFASVPTVNPAVPAKAVAAFGRVNVPVIVSRELIVWVDAAVMVTLAKLMPLVSHVQVAAPWLKIEVPAVIVPELRVIVGDKQRTVPEMAESPAKTNGLATEPAAPVHVPPVKTMVAVPVKLPVVVRPAVFQLNNPVITLASLMVVNPLIVTSWTMVMVCEPLIVQVPAVM
jgi:hypothetical protein